GWTYATTTSLFILFSLVAGWLILGDDVSGATAMGAAVIVAGIYLINRRDRAGSWRSHDGRTSGLRLRTAMSIGIALFWTAGLLATDLGVRDADPLAAAVLVSVIPAVFYAVLATRSGLPRLGGIAARNIRRVLLGGLFFAASGIAFAFALKFEAAGVTAVLTSSSPLFAIVLAFIFLSERLSLAAAAGILLCSMGVVAVILG
ncbi:MAG: EamA family transporter, partial [Chloroflexi bacterium]|nr:EamA family transporter [Chloroflexota bacterium]